MLKKRVLKQIKVLEWQKKLSYTHPRDALLTIYKSIVRPHLDYGDVIYDESQNKSFCNKLESVQYNSALAITGAIRGTLKIKLYKKLGLEFLKSRRWFRHGIRRLCSFYKIKTYKILPYLAQLLPKVTHSHNTRNSEDITTFRSKTETFKFSFFPWSIVVIKHASLFSFSRSIQVFRQQLY